MDTPPGGLRLADRLLAKDQGAPSSLSDHMLQRLSTGNGLSCRPLRRSEGRTHFRSMNSLSQVSSVFSRITILKVNDNAQAKAGLDFDGMKRKVGWSRRHTSSKVGRLCSES